MRSSHEYVLQIHGFLFELGEPTLFTFFATAAAALAAVAASAFLAFIATMLESTGWWGFH